MEMEKRFCLLSFPPFFSFLFFVNEINMASTGSNSNKEDKYLLYASFFTVFSPSSFQSLRLVPSLSRSVCLCFSQSHTLSVFSIDLFIYLCICASLSLFFYLSPLPLTPSRPAYFLSLPPSLAPHNSPFFMPSAPRQFGHSTQQLPRLCIWCQHRPVMQRPSFTPSVRLS